MAIMLLLLTASQQSGGTIPASSATKRDPSKIEGGGAGAGDSGSHNTVTG